MNRNESESSVVDVGVQKEQDTFVISSDNIKTDREFDFQYDEDYGKHYNEFGDVDFNFYYMQRLQMIILFGLVIALILSLAVHLATMRIYNAETK